MSSEINCIALIGKQVCILHFMRRAIRAALTAIRTIEQSFIHQELQHFPS